MSNNKRVIAAEDLYKFELISVPKISPDGEYVVYAQQRVDSITEKKFSNLWVVPTDEGNARQFTYGNQVDNHPKWSPDGSQIAFISTRGDEKQAQFYLIPFKGGEARSLSELKGDIGSFQWSPDGTRIVFQLRKKDPEVIEREEDETKKELGIVQRHYERAFYKFDGYGFLPQERWHIWTLDVESGEASQLTDHDVFDETEPTWTPDGKWIVFQSNRNDDPDLSHGDNDLVVIPSEGGEPRVIKTVGNNTQLPSVSPDGKWIAYFAKRERGQWWQNTDLWVVPFDGSTPPQNLTLDLDFTVEHATINDLNFGGAILLPPTWSPDSQTIYFQVSKHGSSILMSIGEDGKNLQTVIDDKGVVGGYSFDLQHQKLAHFFGTMTDPGQVCLRKLKEVKSRQITQINTWLDDVDLGSVEEVWFKGRDNNNLQGWIMKPPKFDSSRRYPCILEIHGGPLAQYGEFMMHEFYYLAAQGYVVYFSNPRGGQGYGEEHSKAIWGGWGNADYADLMLWADHMAAQPYIDQEKMGITGGSYGGYMTLWTIGHTHQFKSAVAQRVVSNFVSMWGSSDLNWIFQQVMSNKPPWEDLDTLWKHSPMAYIGNANTPTLIIHSENDHRCPIEQGEQAFVALKTLGIDTEMVRFPDEPHGLSRMGRTDRRIVRLNHVSRWMDKYLK
ncbi:MAG: S9 family peptidase [Anaerolineales bacterium]|nr:S9 family peptidase [Chloroflexota bacterium]MBL6982547.1 S9 family peptidase [Anaerolineales bacterium]